MLSTSYPGIEWETLSGSTRIPTTLWRPVFPGQVFIGPDGFQNRRSIRCDVPQRSILGPLLWDIAYNRILCFLLLRGCHAICYADDILVMATGDGWGDTAAKAKMAVAAVVRCISDMGLKVAVSKTEILFFIKVGFSADRHPPMFG